MKFRNFKPKVFDTIFSAIKNALKQDNLNPEIEEKLLNLQRYQEKQMRGEVPIPSTPTISHIQTVTDVNSVKTSIRKRSKNTDDDSDWIIDTPKRRKDRKPYDYMEKHTPGQSSNSSNDNSNFEAATHSRTIVPEKKISIEKIQIVQKASPTKVLIKKEKKPIQQTQFQPQQRHSQSKVLLSPQKQQISPVQQKQNKLQVISIEIF